MTPTQRAAIEKAAELFSRQALGISAWGMTEAHEMAEALRAALAEPAPMQEPETVSVYGVKSNGEVVDTCVKAPMPPRMKAKDMVREMFGPWEEDDGSDSDLCFAVCESLLDWLVAQGWTAQQPAPVQEPTERKAPCARHCEAQAFKIEQRQLVRLTVDFMEIIAKQRVVMQQAWEVLGSMDVGTTSRTLGARVALREVLDIPVAAQQPAPPADVPMLTDDEILNAYYASPPERQYVTVFCVGAKWAEKTLRQKVGLK